MASDDRAKYGLEEPTAMPPGLVSPLTVPALLQALRRRWLLAAVCALLGSACLAAVTWLFLPAPKHVAQTLLHVEAQPPSVVYHQGESRADFQNYQRTQIALVKSRFVLNTALRRPEVAGLRLVRDPIDPIGWLQKELIVDFSTAPELLRIALNGDEPDEIKTVVAQVTRAYLDEIVKREDGRRRERQEKLKEIHERYQDNLRTKRRTLRELIENVGSGDPTTLALKQRYGQEQLAATQKELLQLDSERRKLQTDFAVQTAKLKTGATIEVADADLDELVRQDPAFGKLAAHKDQIQLDITETVRVAVRGANEPRVQKLRKELAGVEATMDTLRGELRPRLMDHLQARLQANLKNHVAAMTERVKTLDELRKVLVVDVDRLSVEGRSLNKGSLDIESYRQDIAQTEETAKKVAGELEAVNVELKAVPRVTELESAFVTQPDDFKRRVLATLAAGLLGLVGCALLVAWWENRARRIQSPSEIVHGLGINLIGTVPPVLAMNADDGVSPRDLGSTDLLEATRARLLHLARVQSARVVLVTSAVAGEGKTTLASTLAASLAQANRKTLLIDGDLRHPAAHRLFGLEQEPGVSEVILGTVSVEQAVQYTAVPGLALISAGQATREAIQALPQENFGSMIKELRDQFDFILVDAAPVLPVADALLIGPHVDGAILSILHDVSQMPKVYAAHEMLKQMGIGILGAVLNGTTSPITDGVFHSNPSIRRPADSTAVA